MMKEEDGQVLQKVGSPAPRALLSAILFENEIYLKINTNIN